MKTRGVSIMYDSLTRSNIRISFDDLISVFRSVARTLTLHKDSDITKKKKSILKALEMFGVNLSEIDAHGGYPTHEGFNDEDYGTNEFNAYYSRYVANKEHLFKSFETIKEVEDFFSLYVTDLLICLRQHPHNSHEN